MKILSTGVNDPSCHMRPKKSKFLEIRGRTFAFIGQERLLFCNMFFFMASAQRHLMTRCSHNDTWLWRRRENLNKWPQKRVRPRGSIVWRGGFHFCLRFRKWKHCPTHDASRKQHEANRNSKHKQHDTRDFNITHASSLLCVCLCYWTLFSFGSREKTVIVLSRIKFECENGVRSGALICCRVSIIMYIHKSAQHKLWRSRSRSAAAP